jgi:hypothetical protein
MKQIITLVALAILCTSSKAQNTDSIPAKNTDTLRIGNIVIIKKGKAKSDVDITMGRKKATRKQNAKCEYKLVDCRFRI